MADRKPFKKVVQSKWIGGVVGGIAYSMGWPVLWLRIVLFAVAMAPFASEKLFYFGGMTLVTYIFLCIFASSWEVDPNDFSERTA